MAELENLLLQAAGRNETSKIEDNNRTKKRKMFSFSESHNYRDQKNPLQRSEIDDSSESEDEEEEDKKFHDHDDLLASSKSRAVLTYEDVKEISIRRSKLAKWFMEPFFQKIIAGCFVRVGIGRTRTGPKYKLCVVNNVDSTNPNRHYKFEGRSTSKWLNCVWGSESSQARWQMAFVSDSPPTEEEFNEWFKEMERNNRGHNIHCRQDVENKMEEIKKATTTFVYSAETVKEMVKQKKSDSSRPIKFAEQKILLKEEIAVAESFGEEAKAERLRVNLKEMEERSRKVKPADYERALRLSEMNRKNKMNNYIKASQVNHYKSIAAPDYSARKWTMPTSSMIVTIAPPDVQTTKVETLEKDEGEGKLVDSLSPRVDYDAELRSMHDFDLPFSLLPLIRYRRAHGADYGLMERKRKIEKSFGNRVPHDYGRRRNVSTISIEDYKRRKTHAADPR